MRRISVGVHTVWVSPNSIQSEDNMLLVNNFDTPDTKHSLVHGEVKEITLGGVQFTRAIFQPGWRWSEDVKPLVGTDSCQATHMAVVVEGIGRASCSRRG